jgi:hypothetical protein
MGLCVTVTKLHVAKALRLAQVPRLTTDGRYRDYNCVENVT